MAGTSAMRGRRAEFKATQGRWGGVAERCSIAKGRSGTGVRRREGGRCGEREQGERRYKGKGKERR